MSLTDSLGTCKIDKKGWRLEDCESIYKLYGAGCSIKCKYSDDGINWTNAVLTTHFEMKYIKFEDEKSCSRIQELGSLDIITDVESDRIIIPLGKNRLYISVENNAVYNIIAAIFIYAGYLYANNLLEKKSPFADYADIDSESISIVQDVYEEYFSKGPIKPIGPFNLTSVNEWSHGEKTGGFWGDMTLSVTPEDITFPEALNHPDSVRLVISIEDECTITTTLNRWNVIKEDKLLSNILITYLNDTYSGITLELLSSDFIEHKDFKQILCYLYVIMLKNDSGKAEAFLAECSRSEISSKNAGSPYDRLNNLIGLHKIKDEVASLVNLSKMQMRRKEQGLKAIPMSLHLVFSGNPGTGKTTIARILADIYKDIGVLSKGQLVEVDRSGLVAGYVGQTAIKTQEKIQEAMGGILFIDEAYTLVKDGNDFGQEAIDTILKAMEDNRDDFIVIVAGYTEQMKKFISSNPGLQSRFNKFIDFPDYSADELIRIFYSMCDEYSYRLDDGAKTVLEKVVYDMERNKSENFANAREVRNLFENVVIRQASRVESQHSDDLLTITAEDIMG